MNTVADLEKVILALPPAEREHIATVAWDSLAGNSRAAGDRSIDAEGIEVASQRDTAIESGLVQSIGRAEFLQRTGGKRE
jgi:hypothetical protein